MSDSYHHSHPSRTTLNPSIQILRNPIWRQTHPYNRFSHHHHHHHNNNNRFTSLKLFRALLNLSLTTWTTLTCFRAPSTFTPYNNSPRICSSRCTTIRNSLHSSPRYCNNHHHRHPLRLLHCRPLLLPQLHFLCISLISSSWLFSGRRRIRIRIQAVHPVFQHPLGHIPVTILHLLVNTFMDYFFLSFYLLEYFLVPSF